MVEGNRKRPREEATETVVIPHLPFDIARVYQGTVQRMVPKVPMRKLVRVAQDADNATLLIEVGSKEEAQVVYKRLQNAAVYGRRWKAEYHPLGAVMPKATPVVVDVRLSSPMVDSDVETVFTTLPGFLAITRAKDTPQEAVDHYCVSFADEGSALHARALLSGRVQDGAHMFLFRR